MASSSVRRGLAHVRDAIAERGDEPDVQRGLDRQDAAGAAAEQHDLARDAEGGDDAGQLQHLGISADRLFLEELLDVVFDPLARAVGELAGNFPRQGAFLGEDLEHFLRVDVPAHPGADTASDACPPRARLARQGDGQPQRQRRATRGPATVAVTRGGLVERQIIRLGKIA